jgi:hypothetical protein
MLAAYFDDSGTHEQSDIVLVAGIFGTEGRMDSLDRNWKRHLDRPLCGRKHRLRRFHATDCNASQGEFSGWTRTETDYFCHQLRMVIIESGVAACGIACSRKDYDELVTGDIRAVLGNPEVMCINQCFVQSIGWVQDNSFDPKMTLVFDSRPSPVKRYVGTVYDAFSRHVQPPPELTGYAFLSSYDVRPLQAADMIAWELYQHANDCLIHGIGLPRRQEFCHLTRNMDFSAQLATRKSIIELRDFWLNRFKEEPELLKEMAAHFTFFDLWTDEAGRRTDGPGHAPLTAKQRKRLAELSHKSTAPQSVSKISVGAGGCDVRSRGA